MRDITPSRLEELQAALLRFNIEREWGQFHGVKNLSMALASEVGELVAVLRWLPPDAAERAALDPQTLGKLEDELGDVLLVLLTLGQRLDVDLLDVAERKLRKNAEKYAVESSRGRSNPAC